MVPYGETSECLAFYLDSFAWVVFGILLDVFAITEAEFVMYKIFQN